MKQFLFFLFLFFSFSANAAGFVETGFKRLEKDLQNKYSTVQILEKISSVKTLPLSSENIASDLALFVAARWIEQSHFDEAQVLLDKIPADDGWRVLADYYQILICLERGEMARASQLIGKLNSVHPDDPDLLLAKCLFLAQKKDLTGALEVIDQAVKKNPKNGRFYLRRGLLHLLALSHDRALKDFIKAEKYLPKTDVRNRQQALLQAGLIELKIFSNNKKAEQYFREGVALYPTSDLVQQLKNVR